MGAVPRSDRLVGGSQKIKDIGRTVIGTSVLVLIMTLLGLVQMYPPMGEIGNFVYESSVVIIPMTLWGVATGIGLMRAWRWSRISMLIFGALLALFCALPALGFLFTGREGFNGWQVAGVRALGLLFLVPSILVARWHWYFLGEEARAYFHSSRRAVKTQLPRPQTDCREVTADGQSR